MREIIGEGETRKKPLLEYDRCEHTGGLKMKTVIIVILSVLSTTAMAEVTIVPYQPFEYHKPVQTQKPKHAGEIYMEHRQREALIRQMELQNQQIKLQNQQMQLQNQQMQLQNQQMQK